MLKEDKKYDLCEILWSDLLRNLNKINHDKKHVFEFGTLIIYLYFYFMNDILSVQKVKWVYDRPMGVQIKETLHGLGVATVQNGILWRYFKTLQSMM